MTLTDIAFRQTREVIGMKSDDVALREMKSQKRRKDRAMTEKSAHELQLFLEYVKKEGVMPDTWYFSITRMRLIPLWTIYEREFCYATQAAYVSSTGKLYEFRGIGYKAPASRYLKRDIVHMLVNIRKQREEQAWQQIVDANS